MKKNIVPAAVFVAFTAACFVLSMVFPDGAMWFLRVWYLAAMAAWFALAAKLVSLAIKLSKIRRAKQKDRKEHKK